MENAISNADLIRQLAEHGVVVEEKTVAKKRDILIKQLNHLMARKRQPSPTKKVTSPRKRQLSPAGTVPDLSEQAGTSLQVTSKRVTRQSLIPQPQSDDALLRPTASRNRPADASPVGRPQISPVGRPPVGRPQASPAAARPQISYGTTNFPTPTGSYIPTATSGATYGNISSVPRNASPVPIYTPAARSNGTPRNTPVASIPVKQRLAGFVDEIKRQLTTWYFIAFGVVVIGITLGVVYTHSPVKIGVNRQLQHDQIQTASSSDRLMICDGNAKTQCFQESVVRKCLPILRYLRSVLDADFVKFRCESNESAESYRGLQIGEAINAAKKAGALKNIPEPDEDALLTLIHANPHWRIQLIDRLGEMAEDAESAVKIRTRDVPLPLACRFAIWSGDLLRFLLRLTAATVCFVLVSGFLVACYWTIRSKLAHRRFLREKTRELAEQIVDAVKKQYDAYASQATPSTPPVSGGPGRLQPFVVIRHLADTLMPMDERTSLAPAWKAAVELIRNSESRIRTEVRLVEGEHVNVWLWTAGIAAASSSADNKVASPYRTPSPGRRQATPRGAAATANSTPPGLTPCLKIRGILSQKAMSRPSSGETSNEALARIREAASSAGSCGTKGIMEVNVRRLKEGSVAVYVRCVDEVASGHLTQALRKSYKDVLVHYIHTDKFNEHFS